MTLLEQIQADQKTALKGGETSRLSTLRLLSSALKNEAIAKMKELSDEEAQAVAARQIKQIKDALSDYEAGKRDDLAAQARQEIQTLTAYLPKQLSDEELKKIVGDTIQALGGASHKDLGRVIGAVMKIISGRADGNRVRQMIEERLK